MFSAFIQAAAVLLREGLEALLVIAALAAYLKKTQAHERVTALYAGAGAAVVASIVAAALFERYNYGVHDDIMEAVIILCAAALMLYVSGWLLLRQDPKAWQGYLTAKADAALAKRTGMAVAALAFLAVFREGAETVLFVHALVETSGGWSVALFAGLLAALVILIVLFVLINLIARRVPLRPLFVVTSGFLFLMAVKFIGEAIREFQEQQIVSYTSIKGADWLSTAGLNPTLEAISAQIIVIVLAVVTFLVLDRRARHCARARAEHAQTSS